MQILITCKSINKLSQFYFYNQFDSICIIIIFLISSTLLIISFKLLCKKLSKHFCRLPLLFLPISHCNKTNRLFSRRLYSGLLLKNQNDSQLQ